MSYSVEIQDPKTKCTIEVAHKHDIKGGTYCLGGTNRLELNVTYNYSAFYHRPEVLGASEQEKAEHDEEWISDHTGFRRLSGMEVGAASFLLLKAIKELRPLHVDENGEPYDMESKYSADTLKKLKELNKSLAKAMKEGNHDDAEIIKDKIHFVEDFCQRPRGYWAPTEANARDALTDLLNLCLLAPNDAIIQIY
jgi:hypothetical protein